ncbi:metal/formaldehyde-sensitive transcriptional repressor [Solimonas marina]|uniref:Metal/formaldehyde-sensitive transcriptional repressor n=1 Tax=Solimonas marina TaxID=2714601 RepID=A0A970B4T2_9GAMM|nr:metal/formaldehyde-sensitive transcriptional repressor [Solimonas marina]NKF20963.1 metal/formaldehyde-sensitive transcriptional repressor [Solimonas marina]
MAHTIRDRKPLLNRVRRLQGQLESLRAAIEGESECGAVLQQIAAVRGGVNGLMSEVLQGHLREHLVPAPGADADEVENVVRVLRSYLK